jgi:hypothetical protein
MSGIAEQAPVDAAVRDFLVQHGAQAHFSRICELVRECFPALLGLEVALQADPDEEGRVQAIVYATLPASYCDDELQGNLKRYYASLVQQIPLSHCPLFALVTEFLPE